MSKTNHSIAVCNKAINLSIIVEAMPTFRLCATCLETSDQAYGDTTLLVVNVILNKIGLRAVKSDKSRRARMGDQPHIIGDFYDPANASYWSCWAIGKPVENLYLADVDFGTYSPKIDVRIFPAESVLP